MEKSYQRSFTDTMLTGAEARRSLKRTWKQLPRLQRNLIIVIISVMCFIVLLLLAFQKMDENIKDRKPLKANGPLQFQSKPFESYGAVVRLNALNQKQSLDVNDNIVNKNLGSLSSTTTRYLLEQNVLAVPEHNIIAAPADNEKPFERAHIQNTPDNELKENMPVAKKSNNPEEDHMAIETVIKHPTALPGTNGVTIEEFLGRIDLKDLPEKKHFHGANNVRQEAVVKAFQHSWKGYKKYAWGHDNLKPISESSDDPFGLGLTIIDSLDTMYIMGLEEEFRGARNWVSESLNLNVIQNVNLFEVSIRVLGGLLSAFHLSADKVFLRKSIELGNRLLPCFLSPTGIPYSHVNMAKLIAYDSQWYTHIATSEATTIQLEFRDLSRITNVSLYERVAHRVNEKVHALKKNNGLVPIYMNADTGRFSNVVTISLGACGDSYYEYLIKQWIQTGRKANDFLVSDYRHAIGGVLSTLLKRTPKENLVYISELIRGKYLKPRMDHLACFLPGTLLLGHHYGMPDTHLQLARDLLETCYQIYMKQPTQLAPEISYFALSKSVEPDIYTNPKDAYNLLRPEFIESLYYFYALTGNHTYQDMGWTIFRAFEKYAKVPHGYTSIGDVRNVDDIRPKDMMESFWLAETLKYFYLLFSDNRKEIDLDKWVFNTEAHPLPIRSN